MRKVIQSAYSSRKPKDANKFWEEWQPLQGCKPKKLSYRAFLDGFRGLLEAAGFPLHNEDGTEKYGIHSLRIGGAQTLCRMNVGIQKIKVWGRWRSWAVERYIRECPIQNLNVAQTFRIDAVMQEVGGSRATKMVQQKIKAGADVMVPWEGRWLEGHVSRAGKKSLRVVVEAAGGAGSPVTLDVAHGAAMAI